MNLAGKKHLYSWKSMSTNFPGSLDTMGFVGFCREPISQSFPIWWIFPPFPMPWEIDEKTHAFSICWSKPQDGNLMEKATYFMEKPWEPISQAFPIRRVSLTFLMLWKIWWKNPYIFHAMKYTIGWESNGKKRPYYGKSINTSFLGFAHSMGLAVFSRNMGNWWENTCIPDVMKYTIKWKMENKHPYYGKSMSTNFPGSPRTVGFVAFSRSVGNW